MPDLSKSAPLLQRPEYDGYTSQHGEDDYYTLSLEKLTRMLDSVSEQSERESIAMDIVSLLFESEKSILKSFSFAEELGLSSKSQVINEFVNRLSKQDSLSSSEKSSQAVSAASKCVSCVTLVELIDIMCGQNYTLLPGTCVTCSLLYSLNNLLCSINCTFNEVTITSPITKKPITAPVPCVTCEIYYLSIALFCGAPNCSCGNYYGSIAPVEPDFHSPKRELNTDAAPNNCIPCYYQYTAYQLVCGDLFSHCATTPTPTPLPSVTPSASSLPPAVSPTSSVSLSSSSSVSLSATPSLSVSASTSPASVTPFPSTTPSASASASNYYYYTYTYYEME